MECCLVLTTHRWTLCKYGCNCWVHLHKQVSITLDLGIACFDLGCYPFGERVTDLGVNDVADIRAWELEYLSWFTWQTFSNRRVILCELEHRLDGQSFVMRYLEYLDIIAVDDSPHSTC